jgi:hypothetical protein
MTPGEAKAAALRGELPELPDRIKNASNEDLEGYLAKDALLQKKMVEHLRKNPIDLKKYKGKIQRIDFSKETD